MNITELALYLKHFSKSQIYDMVSREVIPYKNTGKELVFDKIKIDVWNKKRLAGLRSNEGFMNVQETMVYIGVKKRTLYQWNCEGKIPSSKRGGFLMFNKKEIDKWEKNGRPNVNLM